MNHDQGALAQVEMTQEGDPQELLAPTLGWRGMPAFRPADPREHRLVLSFDSAEELEEFIAEHGIIVAKRTKGTVSAWWPPRDREDLSSLRFEIGDPGKFTQLSPGFEPPERPGGETRRVRWG